MGFFHVFWVFMDPFGSQGLAGIVQFPCLLRLFARVGSALFFGLFRPVGVVDLVLGDAFVDDGPVGGFVKADDGVDVRLVADELLPLFFEAGVLDVGDAG